MTKAAVKKKTRDARLDPPTDLGANAVGDISAALNLLLADVFALYIKTKNFHWHVSGPHFRDYHLMFDARTTRVLENEKDYVEPSDMVAELRDDNKDLVARLRAAHEVCSEHNDSASTSLIEQWIDDAERRHWFLFETSRRGDSAGH